MESLSFYIPAFMAVLLLSAFVKIATTLSILRFGIGLKDSVFGLVVLALSFALSIFVLEPYVSLEDLNIALNSSGTVINEQGKEEKVEKKKELEVIEKKFRPFLEKHTDFELSRRMGRLAAKIHLSQNADKKETVEGSKENLEEKFEDIKSQPFSVLTVAFLISELKEAFQLGLMILIPFLVIDLLVVNIMMALGVFQMSQVAIALPLKILLFFAVDGWSLISEKLIATYIL